jgi:hypothetical protein
VDVDEAVRRPQSRDAEPEETPAASDVESTAAERLRAENAALRAEVERMRRKYEEPPELPAKPKRTKQKEPEQFALVGPGKRTEGEQGFSDEVWDDLGRQLCRMLEERRPGSRWRYYRDSHLVPEGTTFYYAADALRRMWGPLKDEPEPPDPQAFRRLTAAEQDERDSLFRGALARIDEELDRSQALHTEGHEVAAVGLLKHVDLLLARFNLARAREETGDPDWRDLLQESDDDAAFEGWLAANIANP